SPKIISRRSPGGQKTSPGTEPLPERRLCAPCNEKRNAASRARDARLKAEGRPRRDMARARNLELEISGVIPSGC
ncbi:MAG: hypothetical protein OXH87_05860, partial [Rhodospirillaceae bacterium]|nr:hypothetical protein [Rhodospirillaceae bacterium]